MQRRQNDVACRPAIPQELSSEVRISEYIYGIPFLFIMPDGSEFAPPTRQTFPPSFNSRNAYFHSWSPIPIPDISISYCLQIVLTYTLETPTTANLPITVVMSKPIEFLPYYEVPPPISSESFPGDFTLSVRRPLWKSSLYGRLGFVTVSTKEPSPLAYSSDQATVSTECEFDITIECDLAAIRRLRYITVVVQPVISAKTFYSSEKLPCMPSQSLSTDHGSVHIYRDFGSLDSQTFQNFQWTFSNLESAADETADHLGESAPPSYDEDAPVRRDSNVSSRSSGVSRHWVDTSSSERQYACRLQTSICVPITPSRRLQATFSSHLVARAYSVLFDISFGSAYASKMDLEVPLQVAYPRPPMPPLQEDDTILLPAEDEDGTDRSRTWGLPIRLRTHASFDPYTTLSPHGSDMHASEALPTYDELMS
ncbi:hypothetical protein IWW34DRAFT_138920 [Fusarium oxysporum f. sp. albedinis]|nr:hypothetical protein IWW34DRAFT_138920 [Fusarium oxysporum f. sp. albedinis]